jgi:hypothetical protein
MIIMTFRGNDIQYVKEGKRVWYKFYNKQTNKEAETLLMVLSLMFLITMLKSKLRSKVAYVLLFFVKMKWVFL